MSRYHIYHDAMGWHVCLVAPDGTSTDLEAFMTKRDAVLWVASAAEVSQ